MLDPTVRPITPVHAGAMPDPEVLERPKRRRFTAEYKLSILREVDAVTEEGEITAILRRDGTCQGR
jgi:hypothetical protein